VFRHSQSTAASPVWRSYAGGRVLRAFRGQPGLQHNHFPEDWLASTVLARNGLNSQGREEGLSCLGAPLAGIPVRDAGKTECWCILGGREEACVYWGFQRPASRARWGEMIHPQDVPGMRACFDRIFDYHVCSSETVRTQFQQTPVAVENQETCVAEELIGPAWHGFFRRHRVRGSGPGRWAGHELMLAIIVRGTGLLGAGSHASTVTAGQTWLVPGAATDWTWTNRGGDWEVLPARLPTRRENDTPGSTATRSATASAVT
jgi:hypothetical protein